MIRIYLCLDVLNYPVAGFHSLEAAKSYRGGRFRVVEVWVE